MNQGNALSEQEQSLSGEAPAVAKASPFAFIGRGLRFVFSSPTAVIGLVIVLFWVTVAVFAPLFTGYTPFEQDWRAPNQGPSGEHILGTDELGRDLWSRLIYGARVVLVILPISETLWLPGGTAGWGSLTTTGFQGN